MRVDREKCVGCGDCARDCPTGAMRLKDKKALAGDSCAFCGACARICPEGALRMEKTPPGDSLKCESCPIECFIREGFKGACQRYENQDGCLVRVTPLHDFHDVEEEVGADPDESIRRPLITGIGAGTTYPDCKPSPFILRGKRKDVDVVTVATEAPLSYSSLMVKIDTDVHIGEEGAAVLKGKRKVGMVTTEQYGAKMLSIGGVNTLTGKNGIPAVRTIVDLANKKRVRLKVEGGGRLELRVGSPPVIDGRTPGAMRVGCGSATLGLFAPLLLEAADEVIILDSHITGLMSEHAAGRFAGARPSGVHLKFKQSTPGRYFGDHGSGWGGTSMNDPLDVIAGIDEQSAQPGMRLLITETTGRNRRLFQLGKDRVFHRAPLTLEVKKALESISASCEPSLVSAVYMGGAGGSARAGVTRYPIRLTQAIHEGAANLTVGGAPVFILPGGGINFLVDVQRVINGVFYWTPTPAAICPVEYTMNVQDYKKMGGRAKLNIEY